MAVNLSYNEINEIRNWLKSRRINYLDIREELTDHFASKIERIQTEEGHSFSRAFLQARQGFYPNRFKINYLTNSFFKNFGLWFWELKKVFASPIWLGMVFFGLGLIATFSFNLISIERLQTNYSSSILYTILLVLIGESILTRAKTKNAGYITLLCSSYLFHYFILYILWNMYGAQLTQPIDLMIYFSVIYISIIAWLKLLIAKRTEAYQTHKMYLKTL